MNKTINNLKIVEQHLAELERDYQAKHLGGHLVDPQVRFILSNTIADMMHAEPTTQERDV